MKARGSRWKERRGRSKVEGRASKREQAGKMMLGAPSKER
jgi:hypothetical protein